VSVVAFFAAVARRRRPLQGLVVLGLAFYGSWLIYRPAGFLVVAVLLLLDLATDRPT
jgi:hypothetical protein